MQSPDTHDAPIVPSIPTDADRHTTSPPADGAPAGSESRSRARPFDRPPRTDHASPYTRDEEEIEPIVADLR